MQLEFREQYLSISAFDDIDLPKLTVITGINGSGKSHFLTALEEGKIAIKGSGSPLIARFTSESFKLEPERATNQIELHEQKEQVHSFIQSTGHLFNLNNYGIPEDILADWEKIKPPLKDFTDIPEPWQSSIKAFRDNLTNQLEFSYKNNPSASTAINLALSLNRNLLKLSKQEILQELENGTTSYRKTSYLAT
ncbi:hypothetical protein ACLUUI_19270 [Enterobacterales bacterium AW_CKDN230030176-1A_HGKHYDSX7]